MVTNNSIYKASIQKRNSSNGEEQNSFFELVSNIKKIAIIPANGNLKSISFHNNAYSIALATDKGVTNYIFNPENGKSMPHFFRELDFEINKVRRLNDAILLLSSQELPLYGLRKDEERDIIFDEIKAQTLLAIHNTQPLFATFDFDGPKIYWWDGRSIDSIPLASSDIAYGFFDSPYAMEFIPNKYNLITFGNGFNIYHTDFEKKIITHSSKTKLNKLITGASFKDKGEILFLSTLEGQILSVNIFKDGTSKEDTLITQKAPILDLQVTPNGKYMATASIDDKVRIYKLEYSKIPL